MKHKQFIFVTALLFLVLGNTACSFKSDDSETPQVSGSQAVQFDPQKDSDGDRILNGKEVELGLNPYIADIPKLQVSFLQNYRINFTYKMPQFEKDISEFIDTRIGREDPDFKYRVGSILVRDQSLKEAARVGQFSGHIWGDIQERDLSWIKYPEVDARFYQYNQVRYGAVFSDEDLDVKELSIELENSVRLVGHPQFASIKDLELNFYYYSHESQNWELLGSKLIERTFAREQNETFSVTLENIPLELMRDSYLKRGEFIVSEIKDFKIGDSGQSYKMLMESVKAKTVQVVINTPHGIEQHYVAPKGDARLPALLETLVQYNLQDNELVKLGAFKNNLPAYTYLKEVRELDKKGQWFTFTKRLNQHYLAHSFKRGDAVILSYVTGKELASQNAEQFLSLRRDVDGGSDYKLYPFGNITPNSKVNFYLRARHLRGDGIKSDSIRISSAGSCGRNCMVQQYHCDLSINTFSERLNGFSFNKDLSGELAQISLVINQDEYSLKELVDAKKIKVQIDYIDAHFEIMDIDAIQELNPSVENVLALKVKTPHGTTFNGVKLTAMQGRDSYMCPSVTVNFSGANNLPVSVESLDFASRIEPHTDWSRIARGISREYSSPFEVDISAHINNFYN